MAPAHQRGIVKRTHRLLLIGLLVASAAVIAACGGDDGANPTPTVGETTNPNTASFDLTAAVDDYLTALPEGFLAINDVGVFKDGVESTDALIIDVREVGEYEAGHIPGAVSIPLRTVAKNLDKIPMDRQVYVYCRSGFRAAQVLSSLGMLGYGNVLSFRPSWNGWIEAGEEVETKAVMAEVVGAPDIEPEFVAAVDGYLANTPDGFNSAGGAGDVLNAANAGALLLDVRTGDEYAGGHVDGAINVDLRSLAHQIDLVPAEADVVAHGSAGHRAAMSLPVLHVLQRDRSRAYNGSYQSLVDAGAAIAVP